ncbi:hypothetical protein BJ878DRAFT_180679 [Calycina marina]|uniref:ML-like domain-containing protein n=1 Tax=Calycina marina TaxID=1763456 RepID=A0A9P7Z8W5_9HELO|nr:hypothetical protein BJ878DRAFT_180679 [Calycina marina]
MVFSSSWTTAVVSGLAAVSTLMHSAHATAATVQGLSNGVVTTLLEDRVPALYTKNFGDCMGGQSLLNLTAFDAGFYSDNSTVFINMRGTTSLKNESVMFYISVYAYGEDRFDLAFNPCDANFNTLCPLESAVPITGGAIIPVSSSDVSGIIPIALVIPDFEGYATIRIFANSTQTQIGCFEAVMTNGASFAHPAAVSSTLGVFTFIGMLASFVTAIYGVSVPHIRAHYAHSMSVLVVFEAFQSIFFSGALSLNWPSVCAAFWSNFAWSAGQIDSSSMVSAVNRFTGVSGDSSQVGGAGTTTLNNNGGLQQQIYGRSISQLLERTTSSLSSSSEHLTGKIYSRAVTKANSTTSQLFSWAGGPVSPGMPLPGNWSGFAGELVDVNIPVADAFLIGLIWFLILLLLLVIATVLMKFGLELLSKIKWIKSDQLSLFRTHWLGFLGLIVLRTMLIAFFMMMTLTMFQFSNGGEAGPIAIAVIVFVIFFVGAFGAVYYACFYRSRTGQYSTRTDRIHFTSTKVWKFIPAFKATRESSTGVDENPTKPSGLSIPRVEFVASENGKHSVHEDEDYIKKFGWLSGRYRRTRWWFFAFWVVYQFIRACFIGGGRANPTAQVIGLFIWEVIAFIVIICINPFEGTRNTTLAVYMLGISKVATAGLSIAFLPQFNLQRIPTTVIGIIVIIIQGFLVIALLILILLSAISSYMSLTRNREYFRPHNWEGMRMKYFGNMEKKANDVPPTPPALPEEPKEPYFAVKTVRRAPKIEDEGIDDVPDMQVLGPLAQHSIATRQSRSNSMASHYSTVPYGARVHRASWSSYDFQNFQENRADSLTGPPSRSASGMGYQVRPKNSQSSMRSSAATRDPQIRPVGQTIPHRV